MLINIRISELQSNTSNSIPLAVAIAISFNYPIFQILPYNIAMLNNYSNLNDIIYNISLNQDNKNDRNTSKLLVPQPYLGLFGLSIKGRTSSSSSEPP